MLRDKRDFRAVIFSSPQIKTVEEIINFFPDDRIENIEKICEDIETICITHMHYISSSAFTIPDVLKDIEVIKNGRIFYQYSMYIASFNLDDRYVHLLAVPFSKMAVEVFNNFNRLSRGNAIKYQKVDLGKLINASKMGNNLDGDIKISRIEIEIEGDSPTKTVLMSGTNVPISKTFGSVLDSLHNLRIRFRRCRLVFDDRKSIKFAVEIDRFGNYLIPVKAKAKNLPWIIRLLKYFSEGQLIREDSLLPPIGKVKDESEMTDEL